MTPTAPNRTACRNNDPGAADNRDEPELRGNGVHGNRAVGEATQESSDAFEVSGGGGDDVDPAVRVVHPVHRHFVDPQAAALREDQQLGVEEPPGVGDVGQQSLGDVRADRLEAALRVGEAARRESISGSGCSSGR